MFLLELKTVHEYRADLSYESDLSLLRVHLPPVEDGRAAGDHNGVRLLLVLTEASHTLESSQKLVNILLYDESKYASLQEKYLTSNSFVCFSCLNLFISSSSRTSPSTSGGFSFRGATRRFSPFSALPSS